MFDVLITPLLALHLLCVNVAAAGPLVCLWLEWKESRGDALAGRLTTWLGRLAWWTLLVGGVLGLTLGWLSWNDSYQNLWTGPLRGKALWGVAELAFSLVLSGGYVLWRRFTTAGRPWRQFVLLLTGTNLLYHFPFLFSVATSLQASPPESLAPITGAEFRQQWMVQPDVLARVVHVVLASFAVTGVAIIGYALRLQRKGGEQEATRVARWGGWWALVPTLLQVPVGLWLIVALPPAWQSRVLGGDAAATVALAVSMLLALLLLQDLATIALGDVQRPIMVRTMVVLLTVVLLMTGTLRRLRPPVVTRSEGGPSVLISPLNEESYGR